MNLPNIVVLATGGTVAGTAASKGDNIGYTAATLGIAELLGAIDSLRDRPLIGERAAEVEREHAAEPARVLQRQRLVGRRGVHGHRARALGVELERVSRGEVRDREREQRDAEKRGHHLEQAPEQVPPHQGVFARQTLRRSYQAIDGFMPMMPTFTASRFGRLVSQR